MNKLTRILLIAAVLFTAGCFLAEEAPKIVKLQITAPQLFERNPLAGMFNELRPKTQTFAINGDIDNLITGDNGTNVYIPQNSFINRYGEVVTGEVTIELIEIRSVNDFVAANLYTTTNNKLLMSEGMIYINATEAGEAITLAENKELQIEMPNLNTTSVSSDARIYTGEFDSAGVINWVETEDQLTSRKPISLPLDYFNYQNYAAYDFYVELKDGTNWENVIENENLVIDSTRYSQQKFENTYLSTREFNSRYSYIRNVEWALGRMAMDNPFTTDNGFVVIDTSVSSIYMNNLDKDLWYADSLVYAYLVQKSKVVDFGRFTFVSVDNQDVVGAFQEFYKQRISNVVRLNYDNVDFGSNSARDSLKANGLNENEINETIAAFKIRNDLLQKRNNWYAGVSLAINTFKTSSLGWINVDVLYDEPTAKEARLLANITNEAEFEFTSLTLLLYNRRMAIPAKLDDDGNYTFTGEYEPYTKLPIGEVARIVALSTKNDSTYFDMVEIVITEDASYTLNLKPTTAADIQFSLMMGEIVDYDDAL